MVYTCIVLKVAVYTASYSHGLSLPPCSDYIIIINKKSFSTTYLVHIGMPAVF